MRVLFLNSSDTFGGAARAASRLFLGIRSLNSDVSMIVQRKIGDEPSVHGPDPLLGHWRREIRPHLDALPVMLYSNRSRMLFSPAYLPDCLAGKIRAHDPDIIHLHWVCEGMLRIETLKGLRKPIVWTIHDSWPFTGGCHVPFDCSGYRNSCGRCPSLGSTGEKDLSRWIWKRKQRAWRDLDLTIVAPSRWIGDCARSSSLFHEKRIVVIPNGLNLELFRPIEQKSARQLLNLPLDRKLILTGGLNYQNDPNKGYRHIESAVCKLAGKGFGNMVEMIVLGCAKPVVGTSCGIKTHYMGKLNDDISMALLYSCADVFVLPSLQENLPNMIMEAMACGTPCVAFETGGIPDLIDHKINGYMAKPFDADDLADGILWVLDDEQRGIFLSEGTRKKIEKDFSLDQVSRKYTDLYIALADKSGN